MSREAVEILNALLDPDASEALGPGAAWAGLLARAGRDRRAHVESGLAQGELLDGLHVDPADEHAAAPVELAAATDDWPRRYADDTWTIAADLHPEGGLFVHLLGPADAALVLAGGEVALKAGSWTRVEGELAVGEVTIRVAGRDVVLGRV